MLKIAVIEDDRPTSNQLRGWIETAKPGVRVDQWFTRDDAEKAVTQEAYDLIVLDIELGRERNAGVAIINAINRLHGSPVLVVSGMPAEIYRGIMKALDAWDYLQKPVKEHDFIETLLDILREARNPSPNEISGKTGDELSIDPLKQPRPTWKDKPLNLPLTAQRILSALYAHRGATVTYEELFKVVKSGRNKDNIRKHLSTIREAFREIDPDFDRIENVPMRGLRWVDS